jgi:hypothetical protein
LLADGLSEYIPKDIFDQMFEKIHPVGVIIQKHQKKTSQNQ